MTTEIIVLIVLILANGLFSMSEMAVVSARKARLQQRADEGSSGAKTALVLAEQPNRFLSTVQIGITLIGILSGAFGGATIAEQLAGVFEQNPWLAPYSEAIGVGIVVVVVTYFSLVIGELVPKRLALNDAEGIATFVAPLMDFSSKVATPFVNLLSTSTEIILRLLQVKPSNEPTVTEDEVKIMIEQGRLSGVFEDTEQKIVERVFRLSDRKVNSIMTHRSDVVWLDIEDPIDVNINKIIAAGHSNFIVCEGDLDQVVGMARTKDLLAEYVKGGLASIKTSPQLPPLVPERMDALDVVDKLREAMTPMALVIDEYGMIAGMVTLTDILEALIGDVPGLDADEEPEATQREDGSWLVDGMMLVEELQLLLDVDELPAEDANYETVNGLFMAHLGRMPVVGDKFEWHQLRFEVMDMDGHRVDKVLIAPVMSQTQAVSR